VLIIPLKGVKGVSVRKIENSGMNASGSTFIEFDNVLVPKENLIGKENQGFKVIMSNFNTERLFLAAGAIRLARTCFTEAYKRSLRRRTFGHQLIENQVIRAKFASMARGIESCHAWMEQLAAAYSTIQYRRSSSEADPSIGRSESRIGAQIGLLKVQSGKVIMTAPSELSEMSYSYLRYWNTVAERRNRYLEVWVTAKKAQED
jgi:alkylation response protein AidB-like acyl-CoA dehydrogenase